MTSRPRPARMLRELLERREGELRSRASFGPSVGRLCMSMFRFVCPATRSAGADYLTVSSRSSRRSPRGVGGAPGDS